MELNGILEYLKKLKLKKDKSQGSKNNKLIKNLNQQI
jgi:hypothetical protein